MIDGMCHNLIRKFRDAEIVRDNKYAGAGGLVQRGQDPVSIGQVKPSAKPCWRVAKLQQIQRLPCAG